MRISAAPVFTWKNDGAEMSISSSPICSFQQLLPASTSVALTRRAFFSPLLITRTTPARSDTASASTRATCARGNPPVGVHRAISSAPVRRLARMPTRSSPRSRELPR